jgi:hypothetical protein
LSITQAIQPTPMTKQIVWTVPGTVDSAVGRWMATAVWNPSPTVKIRPP